MQDSEAFQIGRQPDQRHVHLLEANPVRFDQRGVGQERSHGRTGRPGRQKGSRDGS
jgi:hypothetical protein